MTTNETQAWRGLKPRWLTAAIKAGKKLDDFLIEGAKPSAKGNGRKKARKARKDSLTHKNWRPQV
jgi:hypothetical protein